MMHRKIIPFLMALLIATSVYAREDKNEIASDRKSVV